PTLIVRPVLHRERRPARVAGGVDRARPDSLAVLVDRVQSRGRADTQNMPAGLRVDRLTGAALLLAALRSDRRGARERLPISCPREHSANATAADKERDR